jgi:hypothetical protein
MDIIFSRTLAPCLICFLILSCTEKQNQTTETVQQPNILFIAVDDLRPELNTYGAKHI